MAAYKSLLGDVIKAEGSVDYSFDAIGHPRNYYAYIVDISFDDTGMVSIQLARERKLILLPAPSEEIDPKLSDNGLCMYVAECYELSNEHCDWKIIASELSASSLFYSTL
jgi:hypothetical protein